MPPLSLLDPALAAPTRVDHATSQRLAQLIQRRNSRCYHNALRGLARLIDATYVEGVAVFETGLQFEHAWLETADGVVDPTPVYAKMPAGVCTYFPGPRWTFDEITALFSPDQDDIATPVLGNDFKTDTPRRQAWIAATLAAFRHLSALHVQYAGRPALPRDEDEAALESLIGSYWPERVKHARAASAEESTVATPLHSASPL